MDRGQFQCSSQQHADTAGRSSSRHEHSAAHARSLELPQVGEDLLQVALEGVGAVDLEPQDVLDLPFGHLGRETDKP